MFLKVFKTCDRLCIFKGTILVAIGLYVTCLYLSTVCVSLLTEICGTIYNVRYVKWNCSVLYTIGTGHPKSARATIGEYKICSTCM